MTSDFPPPMSHYQSPQNVGEMPDADVVGTGSLNGRPPETKLYLKIREGRVTHASFTTFGCAVSVACGSALTELIRGKSLVECWALKEEAIIGEVGKIPAHRRFCPELAVQALRDAILQIAKGLPTNNNDESTTKSSQHQNLP